MSQIWSQSGFAQEQELDSHPCFFSNLRVIRDLLSVLAFTESHKLSSIYIFVEILRRMT